MPNRPSAIALAAITALLPTACVTQPERAVPEPLAEVLVWDGAEQPGVFVGLTTEENDSDSLEDLFFDPGVRVSDVIDGSPAARAGFRAGDVVLSVDGEPVDDPGAFDARLARARVDDDVRLETRRGDQVFDVVLRPIAGPGAVEPPTPRHLVDPSRSRASWATRSDGVALVAAHPESPATRAGLAPGDVVTTIDGVAMDSAREVVRTLTSREPGSRVVLGLADGREVTMTLLSPSTRITQAKLPFLWEYEAQADGSTVELDVVDLVVLRLFHYERDGSERTWELLTLFGWTPFRFGTGVGELSS